MESKGSFSKRVGESVLSNANSVNLIFYSSAFANIKFRIKRIFQENRG